MITVWHFVEGIMTDTSWFQTLKELGQFDNTVGQILSPITVLSVIYGIFWPLKLAKFLGDKRRAYNWVQPSEEGRWQCPWLNYFLRYLAVFHFPLSKKKQKVRKEINDRSNCLGVLHTGYAGPWHPEDSWNSSLFPCPLDIQSWNFNSSMKL